jgi:hypothetical protein
MDALKIDTQRDFVTRQYANLVANGLTEESARGRLREVLGDAALDFIGNVDADAGAKNTPSDDIADRLYKATSELGGNVANTQAAWIQSLAEARLFALDWWRPARTFLLYIVFLLGVAVVIALIYAVFVLPSFSHLDTSMGMGGRGAAEWIRRNGELRLFAPLLVMALMLALLATLWWRMRQRIARLEPLGQSRFAWLHGRSDAAYRELLRLEYASILKAGNVADDAVMEPASRLAGPPSRPAPATGGNALDEQLQQAERLGTFSAELDWQRRLHWSTTQAQLELSRDRLILFARVVFYILIGIMVTVLYLPIFTVASMVGVH